MIKIILFLANLIILNAINHTKDRQTHLLEKYINKTIIDLKLINAVKNQESPEIIQSLLDEGADTCNPELKKIKNSIYYWQNYDFKLMCYPFTEPTHLKNRVECPDDILYDIRNYNFENVTKYFLEYPFMITCGEGIETVLHQPSNPIYSWYGFFSSFNPKDIEMAKLLFAFGARIHIPDRYNNPTWIEMSCTEKLDSDCKLNGEPHLGNILVKIGYWHFNWYS